MGRRRIGNLVIISLIKPTAYHYIKLSHCLVFLKVLHFVWFVGLKIIQEILNEHLLYCFLPPLSTTRTIWSSQRHRGADSDQDVNAQVNLK